jgi:hypothetical protein
LFELTLIELGHVIAPSGASAPAYLHGTKGLSHEANFLLFVSHETAGGIFGVQDNRSALVEASVDQ